MKSFLSDHFGSEIYLKPFPYLALIAANLIWGANFVVAKITLQEFPVMSLSFIRFIAALILIFPFVLTLEPKKRVIKSADLPRIFLVGILMVTFNIALSYEGLARTTAINASALSLSVPILSVLAGWWFLKEKIFVVNLVGILTGLLGTFLILGLPLLTASRGNPTNFLGNSLIVLSGICVVAGTVLAKDLLERYSPLLVTALMFAVGALTFFVPFILDYFKNPTWLAHISIVGALGLLYITVLSTICAYFLLNYGLSRIDVVKANLFQYMEPAVAATFAVPILGERISFSFIIGTCLIVLGVYWGTLGKPHHHHIHYRQHRI